MENGLCPACGFPLSSGTVGGLCPKCVLGSFTAEGVSGGREKFFREDGRAKVVRDPSSGDVVKIGPYRLDKALGRGGMGTVWSAHQEYPVERDVALKIVRTGAVDAPAVDRFRAESRTLAVMSHPNIVRLYEVGETENGEPFFAMEIVPGVPIVEFCDSEKLSIRDRLFLLQKVARAVEHAHRHGIIHRDLKPDNILVSIDREGNFVPKLIDFGIAKTLNEKWPDRTMLTFNGQILGTPQYMSPEQAEGGEIETRSDVFGLGAVLYEMLTGAPPLAGETIAEANMENLLRLIRECEAERPSIRVQTYSIADRDIAAANRNTTIDRWPRQLRDDLDWIALRCLEKSPSQRYDSAGGLADDLQRFLEGEPVDARPPSQAYRLKKFVRKHKALVFSSLSIFCVLVAATWLSVKWAVEATNANALAQDRLADADAVPDFLFEAFRQAAPQNGGSDMLALDVLRQAEEKVVSEFSSQPLIRARIQESIASTYRDLGRADLASSVLEDALRSAEKAPNNEEMIQRLSFLLSGASRASGDAEEAILISRESWRNLSESHGENHPKTHTARLDYCRNLLEAAFWNDGQRNSYLEEVEDTLTEVLDNPSRFPGFNERAYRAVLAQHAAGSGDHEAALAFWDQDLDRHYLDGRARRKGHFWPLSFLVAALRRTDRLEEATAAAELLTLHCRDFFGPHHPNTTTSARYLAGVYEQREQPGASILICRLTALSDESLDPIFEENVARLLRWAEQLQVTREEEKMVGDVLSFISKPQGLNPITPKGVLNPSMAFWCGEHLWNTQDSGMALAFLEHSYSESTSRFGASHPISLIRGNRFAQRCIENGRLEDAAEIVLPQLAGEPLSWRNSFLLDVALDLAEALQSDGDHSGAHDIARRVIELHADSKGEDEERMRRCFKVLTSPAVEEKDSASLVKIYGEMAGAFSEALGEGHPFTLYNRIRQVDSLLANQRPEEALKKIVDFLEDKDINDPRWGAWRISKARATIALERFLEAETILLADWKLFQTMKTSMDDPPPHLDQTLFRLSDTLRLLYQRWPKLEEEKKWRETRDSISESID